MALLWAVTSTRMAEALQSGALHPLRSSIEPTVRPSTRIRLLYASFCLCASFCALLSCSRYRGVSPRATVSNHSNKEIRRGESVKPSHTYYLGQARLHPHVPDGLLIWRQLTAGRARHRIRAYSVFRNPRLVPFTCNQPAWALHMLTSQHRIFALASWAVPDSGRKR